VKFIGSSFSHRSLRGLYDFLLSTDQRGMSLMVDTIMSERRATLLFAPPGAELMKSKKGSNLLIFHCCLCIEVQKISFAKVSDGSQPPMTFDFSLELNSWLLFAAPSCSPT